MALDIKNKKTYYFVDDYGLMLVQNPSWQPHGDQGMGDCIGRTLDAYIAYGYKPFVDAVKSCFVVRSDSKGVYIQGYRHPTKIDAKYNDMSRDHVLNALILMKLAGAETFLKLLAYALRWRISDRHSFTPDLWILMKGLAGNKFLMFIYFLIDIPMFFFSVLWNKILYLWAGVSREVPQAEFIKTLYLKKNNKVKKCLNLALPMYVIEHKAKLLYVLPDSPGKWLEKKIGLLGTFKENYLLKIMFGGRVSKEKVYSYRPMSGWRWSTYLNELNDRDCYIVTKPELLQANVLDVDLLRKMHESSL